MTHISCTQNLSEKWNMPFVLCSLAANVSPWKPIFSMETNFQNSKNWPFSNLNNFFTAKLYMNDIYSVLIIHVWLTNAMNKKNSNCLFFFVSMAAELTGHQSFTKYCNSNANYLVSANRNIDYVRTFWQVYIYLVNEKLKIMKLFKLRLPWQPNHEIVSYFTKESIFKAKHLP